MSAAEESVFDQIENRIGGVPPEAVMRVWDKVEPLLARVVKPETGYSLESVLTALQMAQMQLWVVNDFQGVVVTRIELRPLHKVLWVQFIAGDNLDDWLDDWVLVQEGYARHNGCAAIEFSGRKGWNRFKSPHAKEYRAVLTTFRKEL